MADIGRTRGAGDPTRQVQSVAADGRARDDSHERETQRPPERAAGSEELAVALSNDGGDALAAQLEQDADGATVIRVVARETGETIAVVTPQELRELAERTGLPTGLLLQARS